MYRTMFVYHIMMRCDATFPVEGSVLDRDLTCTIFDFVCFTFSVYDKNKRVAIYLVETVN